jgi:hypothetical protein
MKRIYNIGVAPQDKKARTILEKIQKVDDVYLSITPFWPSRPETSYPPTDFILMSVVSQDEIERKMRAVYPNPVIFIGEYYEHLYEKPLELPENFYFSSYNTPSLFSILRALFKTANTLKLELKSGAIINLYLALNGSRIEKLIPTGKGKVKELSYKEGAILKELFKKPGEVTSYRKLISLGIKKENIPVYISRLRKVLQEIEPNLSIRSARGKGYYVSYGL